MHISVRVMRAQSETARVQCRHIKFTFCPNGSETAMFILELTILSADARPLLSRGCSNYIKTLSITSQTRWISGRLLSTKTGECVRIFMSITISRQ